MQMVVIDLTADENAQEIFETLNARGAQLTAADGSGFGEAGKALGEVGCLGRAASQMASRRVVR